MTTGSTGLVSVVIPCYNAERYLAEAIESALNQTYRPVEVVVVDDGSTDGSGRVADAYGTRIVAVHQRQGGEGAARNAGIRRCTGEYVAFLDADDWWDPAFLATRVGEIEQAPAVDAVVGAAHFAVNGRVVPYEAPKSERLDVGAAAVWMLNKLGGLPIHSALVRRAALPSTKLFPPLRMGCDYAFWLDFSLEHSLRVSNRVLSYYRQHASQATHGRGGMAHWSLHRIARRFWKRRRRALGLERPVGTASTAYVVDLLEDLYFDGGLSDFTPIWWRSLLLDPFQARHVKILCLMAMGALGGEAVFRRLKWSEYEPRRLARKVASRAFHNGRSA